MQASTWHRMPRSKAERGDVGNGVDHPLGVGRADPTTMIVSSVQASASASARTR